MKNILRYPLAFIVVFIAAALGSFFTSSEISTWYATLIKPDFTPPNWIFAPVWFILYVLMAIALARIWGLERSAERKRWICTFVAQLGFNVLWSFLFFSFHGLLTSAIDIVVLWFAVVILTLNSWELDHPSFWLLLPYAAWVTFAMILNIALWWIN
ncbi:MAG TPA: TspO/MBR family protein [Candidatus Paceibacterota bacterium]|nr:TspO/MBR family protein [Candidatus Paceibacterota bacterium]